MRLHFDQHMMMMVVVATWRVVGSLFYDVLQPHQAPPPGVECMDLCCMWHRLQAFQMYNTSEALERFGARACARGHKLLGTLHTTWVRRVLDPAPQPWKNLFFYFGFEGCLSVPGWLHGLLAPFALTVLRLVPEPPWRELSGTPCVRHLL